MKGRLNFFIRLFTIWHRVKEHKTNTTRLDTWNLTGRNAWKRNWSSLERLLVNSPMATQAAEQPISLRKELHSPKIFVPAILTQISTTTKKRFIFFQTFFPFLLLLQLVLPGPFQSETGEQEAKNSSAAMLEMFLIVHYRPKIANGKQ